MESSNSGSFQSSSSGDDEEFDSCFLNIVPPPPHPPAPPPAPPSSTPSPSSFFDPLSPYLVSFPFAPAPPPPPLHSLDLDFSWSKAIQQPPSLSTCTTPAAAAAAAASMSSPAASMNHAARPRAPAAVAPRGSKKRSRVSRRAPTTVLATDTSNFRAMVQQFTGFPAPPFASSTSSAPSSRQRLDLFNIASSSSGASISSFLLRPFPQKILSAATAASFPPITTSAAPSTSSSALESIASMARTSPPDANAPAANSASTSSSFRATSIFNAQNPKQFGLQNTNFFSQNQLLQSPKYSSQSLAAFGARQHHQSSPSSTMGGDLGSFIAAEAMKSSTNWADETVLQDQNKVQRRSKD